MERFFDLARPEREGRGVTAGFVGQITANSFMKREFGAKLVEGFLPSVDLDTIIDTSGAYIPGHGTPTVIVFGRTRRPTSDTLRVVDAVRGEPSQPADPAHGLVWTSIVAHVDQPGTEDRFVRVSDPSRAEFSLHPMTLGVGRDLRKRLEAGARPISSLGLAGITSVTGEDDLYVMPTQADIERLEVSHHVGLIVGTEVRDWRAGVLSAAWPYDEGLDVEPWPDVLRFLWPARTTISKRRRFGTPMLDRGLTWFEWQELYRDKLATPLTITWGEVATHNHFVLDRGGKVFNRTAPVIKLPGSASEEDHLRLLGVLNSATACFWLKQVCQPKGGDPVGKDGARVSKSAWEDRYALNASNVQDMPLPADRPLDLPRRIDALATERAALLDSFAPGAFGEQVRELARRDAELLSAMVSAQEELDWQVLFAYGLVGEEVIGAGVEAPPLALGERAFELVLARQVAAGEVETSWFVRHGSTAITEPPAHWPADYRALVERRIALIAEDPDVGLIERPEYKRRWSGVDPFAERLHRRLVALVLDRLEAEDVWAGEPRLRSVSELADLVRRDAQLAEACALVAGDRDAEVGAVVRGLVLDQAVPFLAAHRHTAAGLRKRAVWERTWELQREEDAAERDGRPGPASIPVPPRYGPTDFMGKASWSLRGKLDVPKERFVLVPGAERGAAEVVAWAGWDEATRARALASRVLELQSEDAADAERLAPLLAGVLELLPWIHQWHPEPDPALGQPLGSFFEDWLDGMLAQLGLTREALRDWRPPAPTRGRRRTAT